MTLEEKLNHIQTTIHAPKDKVNSFGNYKYRTCEQILEALKPMLKEFKLYITLNDEIVEIGGRVYLKATAKLYDTENDGAAIYTTAYAREDEIVKGSIGAQITGAASSYARKYALNGMFAIDDTKDPDDQQILCSWCQKPIVSVENHSAKQIINESNRRYKKPYCLECMKKISVQEKANTAANSKAEKAEKAATK